MGGSTRRMGSRRILKDQHEQQGCVPKVLMAGELDVTIVGHAARLIFQSDHITLRCADVRTAFAIARAPTPNLGPLGKLLTFSELRVLASVGNTKPFEIFPNPSRVIRWLSPRVRELSK